MSNSRRGLMLVLSSPSGAGKTSISKKIIANDRDIEMSISYTTRPIRKSEKNGTDYYFVSQEKFKELKDKNFFVEYALVFGNWYGTPKNLINSNIANGKDIIFDIDWQGTQKLLNYSQLDVVSIFILPPTTKVLENRLKKRAEDSHIIIEKRMDEAKNEISHWIEYDYILINNNIEECTGEILTILNAERKKRIRQSFIFDFVEKLMK